MLQAMPKELQVSSCKHAIEGHVKSCMLHLADVPMSSNLDCQPTACTGLESLPCLEAHNVSRAWNARSVQMKNSKKSDKLGTLALYIGHDNGKDNVV